MINKMFKKSRPNYVGPKIKHMLRHANAAKYSSGTFKGAKILKIKHPSPYNLQFVIKSKRRAEPEPQIIKHLMGHTQELCNYGRLNNGAVMGRPKRLPKDVYVINFVHAGGGRSWDYCVKHCNHFLRNHPHVEYEIYSAVEYNLDGFLPIYQQCSPTEAKATHYYIANDSSVRLDVDWIYRRTQDIKNYPDKLIWLINRLQDMILKIHHMYWNGETNKTLCQISRYLCILNTYATSFSPSSFCMAISPAIRENDHGYFDSLDGCKYSNTKNANKVIKTLADNNPNILKDYRKYNKFCRHHAAFVNFSPNKIVIVKAKPFIKLVKGCIMRLRTHKF